jgi:hypothetical protein
MALMHAAALAGTYRVEPGFLIDAFEPAQTQWVARANAEI